MVIGNERGCAALGWLVAVANQQLGTQVGFIQPAITRPSRRGLNDITQATRRLLASPGGRMLRLGSPIAGKLIPLLAPASGSAKAAVKPSARAVKRRQRISQVGFQPGHQPLPVSTCQCWHMGDQ